MNWKKMTPREQDHCRRLHDRLLAADVTDATVSQVAGHYESVEAWNDGDATLAELCTWTGWTLPATALADADTETAARTRIKTRAARIARMRDELKVELRGMRADLDAGKAAGVGANELVRLAAGGLSKAAVFRHLKVADIEATVRTVLKEFAEEGGLAVLTTITLRSDDAAVDLSLLWEDLEKDPDEFDEASRRDAEDRHFADESARRRWVGSLASELRAHGLHLGLADDPFGDVAKAMADYATGRITELRQDA